MKLIVWLLTETIKKQIWQTEQELLKTGCVFFKPIPYLRTYVITNLMLYLSSSRASMSFLVILIIYTNLAPIMFHAAVPTGAGKTLPQLATILTMEGLFWNLIVHPSCHLYQILYQYHRKLLSFWFSSPSSPMFRASTSSADFFPETFLARESLNRLTHRSIKFIKTIFVASFTSSLSKTNPSIASLVFRNC